MSVGEGGEVAPQDCCNLVDWRFRRLVTSADGSAAPCSARVRVYNSEMMLANGVTMDLDCMTMVAHWVEDRGSALQVSASTSVSSSATSRKKETYKIELPKPMIGGGSQVLERVFFGQPGGIGLSLVCEVLIRPTVIGPDEEGRLIRGPRAVCDIEQLSANSENNSVLVMAEAATSSVRLSSTSLVATVRSVGE